MPYLLAAVLGLVQGITEFLPISSTAHLLVVTKALGLTDTYLGQKHFVDAIQLGSAIAVVIYFWEDLRRLGRGVWQSAHERDWRREEGRLALGMVAGTVPTLALAWVFREVIPESILVIGLASIVMAVGLGLAEVWGKRDRGWPQLRWQDGLWIGLAQSLALVPGVSRSGVTLTAALLLGFEREVGARFSFLLGIPTLTIATLYQSRQAFGSVEDVTLLAIATASTFVFSYGAIAGLLRFFQTRSAWVFVGYRLAFGGSLVLAVFWPGF
ncbi:MAG: undecaprenyl-diphosphate phosphatase [Oscillatoriales cyanobacterium SM2_1_8]|nr:undecaprenyl-diphosphate phosphatase [Oscillatoriales cyanobacterium SM2_1_8]